MIRDLLQAENKNTGKSDEGSEDDSASISATLVNRQPNDESDVMSETACSSAALDRGATSSASSKASCHMASYKPLAKSPSESAKSRSSIPDPVVYEPPDRRRSSAPRNHIDKDDSYLKKTSIEKIEHEQQVDESNGNDDAVTSKTNHSNEGEETGFREDPDVEINGSSTDIRLPEVTDSCSTAEEDVKSQLSRDRSSPEKVSGSLSEKESADEFEEGNSTEGTAEKKSEDLSTQSKSDIPARKSECEATDEQIEMTDQPVSDANTKNGEEYDDSKDIKATGSLNDHQEDQNSEAEPDQRPKSAIVPTSDGTQQQPTEEEDGHIELNTKNDEPRETADEFTSEDTHDKRPDSNSCIRPDSSKLSGAEQEKTEQSEQKTESSTDEEKVNCSQADATKGMESHTDVEIIESSPADDDNGQPKEIEIRLPTPQATSEEISADKSSVARAEECSLNAEHQDNKSGNLDDEKNKGEKEDDDEKNKDEKEDDDENNKKPKEDNDENDDYKEDDDRLSMNGPQEEQMELPVNQAEAREPDQVCSETEAKGGVEAIDSSDPLTVHVEEDEIAENEDADPITNQTEEMISEHQISEESAPTETTPLETDDKDCASLSFVDSSSSKELKRPSSPKKLVKVAVSTSPRKRNGTAPMMGGALSPTKTPKTPDGRKLPPIKAPVGLAPNPNLKNIKSKIGSFDNIKYKPGGGDKKVITMKLEWKAAPKIGSLDRGEKRKDKTPSSTDEPSLTEQVSVKESGEEVPASA